MTVSVDYKSINNESSYKMKELETNPEIVKHFDLLRQTGIWGHVENLQTEINNLESLFGEAVEIFSKNSEAGIINYVTSRLLDRFIPSYLAFVLKEDSFRDRPKIMCFKNMKLIPSPISIESLEPYRKFFSKYPNSISFSLFEYEVHDQKVSAELRPLSPEILVPIIGIGGLYGFIVIGSKVLEGEYTHQEIKYIDRLMKFASIGFQNIIHHKSSITDQKTGLYNHSFFMRRLEEELAMVNRHNAQISIILMDIDHFKRFNDIYGHLVGDQVLVNIAQILEAMTRKEDVAARFGGEEFIILITQSTREKAWIVAERIRKAIEKLRLNPSNGESSVTVSAGVRHISKYNMKSPEELINEADNALYDSKRRGRNRTTMYKPGLLFLASKYSGRNDNGKA